MLKNVFRNSLTGRGFVLRPFILLVLAVLALTVSGCGEAKVEQAPEFIIKTRVMSLSSERFLEELELKRAAYPYDIKEDTSDYNEMVIYLAQMLSEELILLSAAQDKGILVTDEAFEAAVAEFKKEYPEDSFEEILLKNAISYPVWEKRFRANMIMEKLIDQEINQKLEITSQDIVDFYKKNSVIGFESVPAVKAAKASGGSKKLKKSKTSKGETKDLADGVGETTLVLKKIGNEKELVKRLRRQKTEDQYDGWMAQLSTEYPVEIDKEKLKKFLIDIEKSEEKDD